MKWAVEIQNTNLDRRILTDLLDSLEYSLFDGIQFPAFTSLEMNRCDNAVKVFDMAKKVRGAFTGPAQIDPAFVLGSVIDFSFDPPKRHAFLEVDSAVLKVSAENVVIPISPPKGLSADEIERWKEEHAEREYQAKLESQRARLEPAYWNPLAAKVLELLSTEKPSGETIFKIYEIAEGNPDNRKAFQAQFGVSGDQFSRFSDSVHNPTVSGEWARHAYGKAPKTNNPMSKDEAEDFVRQIAAKWLEFVRAKTTV